MVDMEVPKVDMVRGLVVDDEELVHQAMARLVAATEGFVLVGSAATGDESLVVAATARPDLVLMDINLLGIDGPEATRRLQAFHPRPIVLLISTYDDGDADYLLCGAP